MNATKDRNLAKDEIQQARKAIRTSWSPEQREQRQRRASTRQQWLLNVLLAPSAASFERVA